ncbi:MAG: helix-turn-helix domain-containing protein [Prevotella sp.]|nr:helix-turn-helix domain-containing protein [Prevotella sp.]
MAENIEQLKSENERLKAKIDELEQQINHLREQFVRLMTHNLDLSERLEGDMEMRRRVDVAREMMDGNVERMRNADLRDDAQLMAIVELKVEKERLHLDPDFDAAALARLIGISRDRLNKLFRHQTIHRTPEAYIDNLRLLAAMRLLREKPNYNIASISDDAGFKHVRTMQRRMVEVIGMTPAEYRALYTRDIEE